MQITAENLANLNKVRDAVVLLGTNLSIGDYARSGSTKLRIMAEVTAHTVRFVDDFQVGFTFSHSETSRSRARTGRECRYSFAPVGFEGSSGLTTKELISLANQVEACLIVPLRCKKILGRSQAAFPCRSYF